jgi:hypothetical protein
MLYTEVGCPPYLAKDLESAALCEFGTGQMGCDVLCVLSALDSPVNSL